MNNQNYIPPKEWTIECGDYLSQCDDYEVQHQKLLKKDKYQRLVLKGAATMFVFTVFIFVLRIVAKM